MTRDPRPRARPPADRPRHRLVSARRPRSWRSSASSRCSRSSSTPALARRASPGFPAVVSGAATLATLRGRGARRAARAGAGARAARHRARRRSREGRPDEDVLRRAAAALFPACYLGLPLGLAVALRTQWSAAVLLLPFLTIVVSDSASTTAGRLFGRTPLAPAISPKKTVEGAIGGIMAAASRHAAGSVARASRRRRGCRSPSWAAARRRRHCRRPVRVAAQAQRRRQGFLGRSSPATAACSIASTRCCSPVRRYYLFLVSAGW